MRSIARFGTFLALLVALIQPVGTQQSDSLMSDLTRDVKQVHSKMMQLAKAMPDQVRRCIQGMGASAYRFE